MSVHVRLAQRPGSPDGTLIAPPLGGGQGVGPAQVERLDRHRRTGATPRAPSRASTPAIDVERVERRAANRSG